MIRKFRICLAAGAITLSAAPVLAASLQVAPTTINLPARGGNAVVYVSNNGSTPIGVHVEAFAWSQNPAGDELGPSRAIQVSPPMTQLEPHERQTIRLRVKSSTGAEQSFRVVANELPEARETVHNGVRVLFRFSIPVFAGSEPNFPPEALEWQLHTTPSGSVLSVHNSATAHAKLAALKLVPSDGSPRSITDGRLVYVLAGASQQWKLGTLKVETGKPIHVEAYDERRQSEVTFPVESAR